jgi:hypothetical protein
MLITLNVKEASMNRLCRFVALAAASAALGVTALAASPAVAQGWNNDGYRRDWRDEDRGPYGRPRFGYNNYDTDAGEMDIAICPPGYHLGRSARLCWPD